MLGKESSLSTSLAFDFPLNLCFSYSCPTMMAIPPTGPILVTCDCRSAGSSRCTTQPFYTVEATWLHLSRSKMAPTSRTELRGLQACRAACSPFPRPSPELCFGVHFWDRAVASSGRKAPQSSDCFQKMHSKLRWGGAYAAQEDGEQAHGLPGPRKASARPAATRRMGVRVQGDQIRRPRPVLGLPGVSHLEVPHALLNDHVAAY